MYIFFQVIKYHIGYIIYVLITAKERREFMISEDRGYQCVDSHDDSYLLYGSATKFYFDKTKAPERNYLTRKEYRKYYHPKNENKFYGHKRRKELRKLDKQK